MSSLTHYRVDNCNDIGTEWFSRMFYSFNVQANKQNVTSHKITSCKDIYSLNI